MMQLIQMQRLGVQEEMVIMHTMQHGHDYFLHQCTTFNLYIYLQAAKDLKFNQLRD
jgi:hypothetical protein